MILKIIKNKMVYFFKKIKKNLHNSKIGCIFAPQLSDTHQYFSVVIGLWCNGSTTVFGSVSLGSNPGRPSVRFKSERTAIASSDVSLGWQLWFYSCL